MVQPVMKSPRMWEYAFAAAVLATLTWIYASGVQDLEPPPPDLAEVEGFPQHVVSRCVGEFFQNCRVEFNLANVPYRLRYRDRGIAYEKVKRVLRSHQLVGVVYHACENRHCEVEGIRQGDRSIVSIEERANEAEHRQFHYSLATGVFVAAAVAAGGAAILGIGR